MHHLDNWGLFEAGPSRFTINMVLRMPPRLVTMWHDISCHIVTKVISKFSVLLASYLAKWYVVVKNKLKINYRPLYIDIYKQINSENNKLFEVVKMVLFPFRNGPSNFKMGSGEIH